MSFNIGHVSGGTHAGWRKVKQAVKVWECRCPVGPRPGYLAACPDCGARRPDAA